MTQLRRRYRSEATTVALNHPPITEDLGAHDMLLHEILARTRMREDQYRASRARLARRLARVYRSRRRARSTEPQPHR